MRLYCAFCLSHTYQKCGFPILLLRKATQFIMLWQGCVCCMMGQVQCTISHQAASSQASTFEELPRGFGTSVSATTRKKQTQKSSHFGSQHCLYNTSITRQTLSFALCSMLYSSLSAPWACFVDDV